MMGHESIHTTLHYQKVTSQKAEEATRLAFSPLTNVDKLD
jgi:integrase/recombinase XerD